MRGTGSNMKQKESDDLQRSVKVREGYLKKSVKGYKSLKRVDAHASRSYRVKFMGQVSVSG